MVSLSGIPHAYVPRCFSVNVSPPGTKKIEACVLFFTWHNLCSELITVPAAKQDDGVGKRRRRPSRVTISRLAVIVFDKDDDCDRLLFFEFDTC